MLASVVLASGKILMLLRRFSAVTALTVLVLTLSVNPAYGQFYFGGGLMPRPTYASMTSCYQTVPVTSMVESREKVQVGTWKTVQESREYTVMTPKTEYRDMEITEMKYQTVVENQTVTRDTGRWITQYHPVAKYSPCQVDPRPGMIGWMNRTGYSLRSALLPNYTTSRQYVPNVTTVNVPVTRQVAIPTRRIVRVPETRLVAEKRVEQVPVRKLVFEEQERMVARPQTVWRQVPMGSRVAMNSWGYSPRVAYVRPLDGAQSAAVPTKDPISTKAAVRPDNGGQRSFQRNSEGTSTPVQPGSFQRDLPETQETPDFSFPTSSTNGPSGSSQASDLTAQKNPTRSSWRAARGVRRRTDSNNSAQQPVSVLSAVTED